MRGRMAGKPFIFTKVEEREKANTASISGRPNINEIQRETVDLCPDFLGANLISKPEINTHKDY